MRNTSRNRNGFTLVEMSISAAILVIAVAIAMAGLLHALQGYNQADAQDELDSDVQVAMERLKYDLRLSAVDKMTFYPEGSGPYTAISFPLAHPEPGELQVPTNGQGFIIWDQTVVYHVKTGTPYQLRMTVFEPRDNTLTGVERQEQLDSVVLNGDGSATHNSANANTRILFQNLFNWTISPQGSIYDAYSPNLERDITVDLGVCIMDTGTNTIGFSLIGRNNDSAGYLVGIDTIVATPSGPIEAEALLPYKTKVGPEPVKMYMPGGSWSHNHQLYFPAIQTSNEFTLVVYNDTWLETNFRRTGYSADRTDISFDPVLRDYVVSLIGNEQSWTAPEQTGDASGTALPNDTLRECAVRVLLRGTEMQNGGYIRYSGGKAAVCFKAATNGNFGINQAFIAECTSSNTPSMNFAAGTGVPLTFGGAVATTINSGGSAWSDYVNIEIDSDKSYLVSFLTSSVTNQGNPCRWDEYYTNVLGCCVITNADAADHIDPNWDIRADASGTSGMLGVWAMWTRYPTNGIYISGPYDTQLDAPVYQDIDWDVDMPANASVSFKVRSGSDQLMSDADAWSTRPDIAAPGLLVGVPAKRFVQWRAVILPNTGEVDPQDDMMYSPRLKDVTIRWPGEERLTSIGGVYTKGTNYGTYAVTINGDPLVAGVIVDLEIFADIRGFGRARRMTSRLLSEIHPRNTAK